MELDRMCLRRLWVLMDHMPDGAWIGLMRKRGSRSRVSSVTDLAAFFGKLRQ